MHAPLEVTFRGMDRSPATEELIGRWARRLERVHDHIQHCAVTIDLPHRSQRHGEQFQVRIVVGIPHGTIVVSRDRDLTHDDVYVAIADAFHAARRQLQDHARVARD